MRTDEANELNWRAAAPDSLNSFEGVITFRDTECCTYIVSYVLDNDHTFLRKNSFFSIGELSAVP